MQEKKNQKDLKELAVFEMLEDAANDSSFCSTSSRVKTLMDHSILPSPQVPVQTYSNSDSIAFSGKISLYKFNPSPNQRWLKSAEHTRHRRSHT